MPRRLTQEFLFAGAIALIACPAHAAAISGGAGVDCQAGPNAQSYRGALLFGSANVVPGDLTVAAIRYEDSHLGPGMSGFASGLPLAKNLGNSGSGTESRTDRRINSAGQLGVRFLVP